MRRLIPAVILAAILLAAGCTQEAPRTGSLEITSTPADLEVQVVLDGNFRGVTPILLTNLSAGSHLLQLRAPAYMEKVELVTIAAGQKMSIAADYPPNPTPAPATPIPLPTPEPTASPTEKPTEVAETPVPPGSLYVDSFPQGATILLDGKGYGVTPNLIGGLAPKAYELRLVLVGWKDYRIVVSVSPGLVEKEFAYLELQ